MNVAIDVSARQSFSLHIQSMPLLQLGFQFVLDHMLLSTSTAFMQMPGLAETGRAQPTRLPSQIQHSLFNKLQQDRGVWAVLQQWVIATHVRPMLLPEEIKMVSMAAQTSLDASYCVATEQRHTQSSIGS